ncbi:hypothetical protein D9757_012884 [Collybiopsis confluens]|uniref:HAT C-terminal dimerisation domain-containing protein n=1 Tax=Collybiopsis confluens TaxID=2823264 RepID=A0A8H5G8B1_9AGAR|nr:hypothetical protein D9757_012884 [Collybiopsis confluens]
MRKNQLIPRSQHPIQKLKVAENSPPFLLMTPIAMGAGIRRAMDQLSFRAELTGWILSSGGEYWHGQQFGTTWISLARDYLSIMGASTSSEQAFSGGGLIITKLRNQLRGNLVEALQVTKVTLRQELIVRKPAPSVQLEEKLDQDDAEESGNMFGINTGEQEIYVRGRS